MLRVTGDDAALGQLISDLNRVVEESKRLPAYVGGAVQRQVRSSFERGQAPDGGRWRRPRRGGSPLRDTGRLMRSFVLSVGGGGFTLASTFFWAGVHNEGATIYPKRGAWLTFPVGRGSGQRFARARKVEIPERRFIPEPGKEGRLWTAAIQETVDAAIFSLVRV